MKTQNLVIICVTIVLSLLIVGMIVEEANAQTIEPVPTVIAADEAKIQLIQLILQLIAHYQAQLEAMEVKEEIIVPELVLEEREVITVTSQKPGEFAERSEDLSRTVTLASFAVYAEKESLNGSTFRALVRDIPYGQPRVKYTCPSVIKKGDTKTCRVKITGVGGYSAIKYSIQDVVIEATDGTDYRGKFEAVEGIIKDK